MHDMAVDVEKAGPVRLFVNQMIIPDLVVEGAGLCHNHDPVAVLIPLRIRMIVRRAMVISVRPACV
jgi:hypothetical protein